MRRKPTRIFINLLFAIAVIAVGGCYTMQSAKIKTTNQTHVFVSNYGWSLFNTIPLACGNANTDPILPWVLFRNDVTMDHLQSRLLHYADGLNCDASELSYTSYSSVMFNIPGVDFPVPIPYLLTYHEIQLSGILTQKAEKGGEQ